MTRNDALSSLSALSPLSLNKAVTSKFALSSIVSRMVAIYHPKRLAQFNMAE